MKATIESKMFNSDSDMVNHIAKTCDTVESVYTAMCVAFAGWFVKWNVAGQTVELRRSAISNRVAIISA